MANSINKELTQNSGLSGSLKSKSVVDQIIDRLTTAILVGELKPGEKIPTEIELCESMQVGRNSVREAIKALVTMGVLIIKRSEGTFVAEGFSERMISPMLYGMVLEGGNTYALVELRKLFETGILQMAIEKANAEDIKKLHTAVEKMDRLVKDGAHSKELQNADVEFHDLLQEAVHNPLVEKFYTIIERLSHPTRILAVEQFIQHDEQQQMLELHYEIVRIVEEKDETKVKQAIDNHFRYWTVNVKTKE